MASIFTQQGEMIRWREATWLQRLRMSVFWGVGWGVVFPAMLIGALWLLGSMVEGIGRHNTEHDRCLKHASNGYEIKQCR
jgi:hypothetical protein